MQQKRRNARNARNARMQASNLLLQPCPSIRRQLLRHDRLQERGNQNSVVRSVSGKVRVSFSIYCTMLCKRTIWWVTRVCPLSSRKWSFLVQKYNTQVPFRIPPFTYDSAVTFRIFCSTFYLPLSTFYQ